MSIFYQLEEYKDGCKTICDQLQMVESEPDLNSVMTDKLKDARRPIEKAIKYLMEAMEKFENDQDLETYDCTTPMNYTGSRAA